MKAYKIVEAIRLDSRNWYITLENGDTWNFKRREYVDVNGNPIYEVYPPYELELKTNTNIGRKNNKKGCYVSNGYVGIENIGHSMSPIEKNTDINYILKQFYNN